MKTLPAMLSLLLFLRMFISIGSLAVISIDLGNEYMKIGIVKPGVPMEIVLNGESKRKSATVVSLRNNEREFGDPALNLAVRFPQSSYRFIRELLAKNMSNPVVQEFQQRYPYYIMEDDLQRATINFVHPDGNKYSVEELLAMIMESAKHYAEKEAQQKISDAVIVCPAHFNQAERRALKRAGEMAGLKVLQLINSHAAVALNYGVFRRKEFNSTAQNYMFFDMGSTSTTAVIISYQVVKMKAGTIVETNPQLTVKGIGVDQSLGALEITLRLKEHLAKAFNSQGKTKNDVTKNNRAMAKLHKEAERVKLILSANADVYAQIENLMDDQDFKVKVSRSEMISMCEDIFQRVGKPVLDALKSSEMTMGEITEVILMGGGTRIPRVQEELQKAIGREDLGKSINTDEAAALGAVYQAAHLSKGFKVKTFAIKDANIYPIQVEFERTKMDDAGEETTKVVKRTLFGHMNPYPQKKVMTFNKHNHDFDFNVNYGDMSFLPDEKLAAFGSFNLSTVSLNGVGEAVTKNDNNYTESKGVKAHFNMDDSGILNLDNVEFVFESMSNPDSEESTLSKLSNTISNFFSGSNPETKSVDESQADNASPDSSEERKEDGKEEQSNDNSKQAKETDSKQAKETEEQKGSLDTDSVKETSAENVSVPENKTDTTETTEAADNSTASETSKPKEEVKPQIIREEIKATMKRLDSSDPDLNSFEASINLIYELTKQDQNRQKLAAVKNDLEAYSYEARNKLYEEDYEMCSTEEERETIRNKITEVMDWYDEGLDTGLEAYEDKLKELKKACRDLFKRVLEYKERPKAMGALKDALNHTSVMLKSMQNFTVHQDEGPFTEVELDSLSVLIKETKEWKAKVQKEQKGKQPHEEPAFTAEDVAIKIRALDREVKYLLGKAKTWVPKKPKIDIKDLNMTKVEEELEKLKANSSTTESQADLKTTGDEPTIEKTESDESETQEDSPPILESTEPIEEPTLELGDGKLPEMAQADDESPEKTDDDGNSLPNGDSPHSEL